MRITFIKNTPTHHTFSIRRADGSIESASLETRSYMPHDLIHFAYETEAGCSQSFYGWLAAGTPLAAFKDMDVMNSTDQADIELIMTERITGPLTSYLSGGMTSTQFLSALNNLFDAQGAFIPDHLQPEFLDNIKIRYNQLMGQWNALPHHIPMVLQWKILK